MDGHVSVLRHESLQWLACHPGGRYLDCTAGYGGHAEAILQATDPDGVVVAIDRDADALAVARDRLKSYAGRLHLIHGDFRELRTHLSSLGITDVDGVMFDLGVSSGQLDRAGRGFSFMQDGPLDMRMDRRQHRTAADIVNTLPEEELADVIYLYGEERYSRRIARAIAQSRAHAPLRTTQELVSVLRAAVPGPYRHGRIHFATRTFQALRIAVNQELEGLDRAFRDAAEALVPEGRLCIISFHSLEDRVAKQTIRLLASGANPLVRPLTKKPVIPSEAERSQNPRARSAKLRVAERLRTGENP
jgi:16S rRNA (cytosine1402-N4)-methyltransferase